MKKLWVICLSLCILLTGCSSKEEKDTPELLEPVSVNVDTAVVTKDEIYSIATYPAYVVPYTEELCFPVAGTVASIDVTAGEKVEEGQVLASLDERNLQTQIDALKYSIENGKKNNEFTNSSARCDIDILKLELARLQEDYKAAADEDLKTSLKQSIDLKKADIEIAELKLAQALQLQEYELQKQEQDLEKLSEEAGNNKIKAPFSGEIVYITGITDNSYVEADRSVIIIADTAKLLLEGDFISENTLKNCSRYYALYNSSEYEISYVPMDTKQYLKIVLSGGTPTTKFTLNNMDNGLSIGDFAGICVLENYKQETLVVPAKAVYSDAEGKYVYRMDETTKVRQSVKVGITTDSTVEITSGLEEGDVVYVRN